MPKLKTHKGLAKRVKVTAKRKIKHHQPGTSHLMSGKSAKGRRGLRRPTVIRSNTTTKRLLTALQS